MKLESVYVYTTAEQILGSNIRPLPIIIMDRKNYVGLFRYNWYSCVFSKFNSRTLLTIQLQLYKREHLDLE